MKILMGSDSPNIPSGFAQQLKGVAQYLAKEGHEVSYLGWQTRYDHETKDLDFKILGVTSQFGKADWEGAFIKTQPDIVISLGDAHMVEALARIAKRPLWFMYYPLDGHPISKFIGNTIRSSDVPIAMANYGWQLTKNELGIEPQYIPHFYKPEEFYDMGEEMKPIVRKELGIPEEAFVIGSVARLNPRKHHQRLLYAFRLFLNKYPEEEQKNIYLYLHLDPRDPLMYQDPNHNYQFLELIDTMGLAKNVIITPDNSYNSGLPVSHVNKLYNSFDVHVIPTGGEGFGVPFIECAATGVPTIATNYTTTKEHLTLINPYTDKVIKKERDYRGLSIPYTRLNMELAMVQKSWIDVEALAEALERYYVYRDLLKRHGDNARAYVEQYYQYDTIMERWGEMLDRVYTNVELVPLSTEMKPV